MDVFRIIKQKGYRFVDLNEDNQNRIAILNILRDDFEHFEYQGGSDVSGIVNDMVQEIAEDVIEEVKLWLDIQIAEYQITLAENQEDEVNV